jgi:hypothetical protein
MTKPVFVDEAFELNINRLKRLGHLKRGERSAASISWGKKLEVGLEHDGRDTLLLRFQDGRTQKLRVVRIPIPCGGYRWLFHLGSRRVVKLFMPRGGDLFRSRTAWGLEYRCRHLSRKNRREARVKKMYMRHGPVFDAWRPKGWWRSTWERRVTELRLLEHAARWYGRDDRQQELIRSRGREGAPQF